MSTKQLIIDGLREQIHNQGNRITDLEAKLNYATARLETIAAGLVYSKEVEHLSACDYGTKARKMAATGLGVLAVMRHR